MSYLNIRHRSRSRYYMSPVLLDHHNLKWIWLSAGLLLFVTFFGGYIVGFEKSNNKWLAKLDPVEITLPHAQVSELSTVEPQRPEIEEPGASIDVDSTDKPVVEKVLVKAAIIKFPEATAAVIEKKRVKPIAKKGSDSPVEQNRATQKTVALHVEKASTPFNTPVEAKSVIKSVPSNRAPDADKSVENKQDTELLSEPSTEIISIVDDATEETARFTIQVGMYRSFNNASVKVERLIGSNLSAYLQDYKNKNDEMRYNVRFGYFNSYSNAEQALNIYQQSYSGTGYVARFDRE